MFLFGEGAAVAGGDIATLEGRVGGTGLREGGGLVGHSEKEGDIDPITVNREK